MPHNGPVATDTARGGAEAAAATAAERWRRAAVVGALWAASEIVLGSFLHNLRVPLRGHLLTVVAVALLAATRRRWPLPGVAWRAGLVAAVMKSVSPSAVLLGPMIAITMEGLLFEAGARIGRRGVVACAIGGALAMTWTFLHQVGSLLIAFGPDLVEVYRRLAEALPRVADLPFGGWTPIAGVLALELATGAGAALFGWSAASGACTTSAAAARTGTATVPRVASRPESPSPSLPVLAALVAALPAGLVALGRLPLAGAAAVALGGVGLLAWRDRRTLRRLARPSLWLAIFAVSAAAAVAFASLPGGRVSPGAGLEAAARLTLRALFVVSVFSGIGRELAHPAVRRVATRLGSGPLMDAVEAAFAALPRAIAALPPPSDVARRPRAAVATMVADLDGLLRDVARTPARPVLLLTGRQGSGKTTAAAAVADRAAAAGLQVAGVLAPGTVRDGRRWSFDVVDLRNGHRAPLGTREHPPGWIDLGGFRVSPDGLELGRRALSAPAVRGADLVVVDEVGPWELAGEGWGPALDRLIAGDLPLLLVARESLADAVVDRWGLGGGIHVLRTDAAPERTAGTAVSVLLAASAGAAGPPDAR